MKRDEVPPNNITRAPIAISDSTSASRDYLNSLINYLLDAIHQCLRLNQSKDETIEYISTKTEIQPAYVKTVWDRLEKENPEFFDNYYKGLQHREHPIFSFTPVNHSLAGYPSNNQPHFNSTSHGMPNLYPFNVENNVVMENSAASMVPFVPPISSTSSTSKMNANASNRASSQGLKLAQDNEDLGSEYLWDFLLPQPTSDVSSTDSGALGDKFPAMPDHFETTLDESVFDESEVYGLLSMWQEGSLAAQIPLDPKHENVPIKLQNS